MVFHDSQRECPYDDFLCELRRLGVKTKRIEASIQTLSEKGLELAANDLIDHIEGKLWELKPDPFRVFFYQGERAFILLNGYRKKGKKTPAKHLNRARRLYQEAMEEMEGA